MTVAVAPRVRLEEQCATLLADALRWWPMTGAAVCVVDGDGTVIDVCDGTAGLGSMQPVTGHSRFEIGSISKSFTSFALLQLAEQGRVDLSASVMDYLPWFSVQGGFGAITLRHLLHHTSGLNAGSDAFADALPQALLLSDSTTAAPPGDFFHYSNAGYILLGLVIEQITGRSLAAVTREQLLQPLAMHETAGAITADGHHLMVSGTQPLRHDQPILPGDVLAPAVLVEADGGEGHIVSTSTDMGRYARMLIGRGELDGVRVLSEASIRQTMRDRAPSDALANIPGRYGLGLIVEKKNGHTLLTHSGGMVGYNSHLAVDMTAGIGVVVLTNANGGSGPAEMLSRAILDLATGGVGVGSARLNRSRVRDSQRYEGIWTDGTSTIQVVRGATEDGLALIADGVSGAFYGTPQTRLACAHPSWRRFHHHLVGGDGDERWVYGEQVLTRIGLERGSEARDAGSEASTLVGHYRSYSPWYPSFRIVVRAGSLHLIAATGVEAPTDDPILVPLGPGVFRIGQDARLPERLVAGPVVDGSTAWVERDGFRYSRFFRA